MKCRRGAQISTENRLLAHEVSRRHVEDGDVERIQRIRVVRVEVDRRQIGAIGRKRWVKLARSERRDVTILGVPRYDRRGEVVRASDDVWDRRG